MELDTTISTPTEDTSGKVEAPKVEAPAQAAPSAAAPKLKSPDEYFADHAAGKNATPAATTEKAPANSAAVAAPDQSAAATADTSGSTDDPIKLREENAKLTERIQQFEQARQTADVQQLTQRQQAELAQDKTLLDKTTAALDRKVTQCQNILAQIAQAKSEGDYETVEELNARYAEAYDDAIVLENNKLKADREFQAKSKYFNDQYAKSREADGNRALDAIFKPYGLDAKTVLEKVPEQYRANLLAVTDTALKTVVASKDAEIAELKKQLSEVGTKANAEARSKWDGNNPGSVPHKNVSGGSSGVTRFSKDVDSNYWFEQHQKERAAR